MGESPAETFAATVSLAVCLALLFVGIFYAYPALWLAP